MAGPPVIFSSASKNGNGSVGHAGPSEDGLSDEGSSTSGGRLRKDAIVGEVRVCRDCRRLVFRRREQILEAANPPPIMKICQVCFWEWKGKQGPPNFLLVLPSI